MKDFILNNKLFVFCIILYIVLTFPAMLMHTPYYDEAHAWMLARFMTPDNLITILREEGHPMLWYLILMPFAKLNILYPYSMLVINYVFCVSSIVLMWRKAPFSNWIKVIVTFSSMFLIFFPVCARNYSIGVLGLFLLASLYREKLKTPLLYSFIVILTANTHLICAIGASCFGILHLYELIKYNRRNFIKSAAIIMMGCIIFLFPYVHGYGCESSRYFGEPGLVNMLKFFASYYFMFGIIYLSVLCYVLKYKNVEARFFAIYTFVAMVCLFAFVYNGRAHHFLFMFLYLLFPFWIDTASEKNSENLKVVILMLGFMFLLPLNGKLWYFFNFDKMHIKSFINIINEQQIPKDSILYVDLKYYDIIPFLKYKNIYDFCSLKPIDYHTSLYCNKREWRIDEIMQGKPEVYVVTDLYSPQAEKIIHYTIGNNGHYLYKIREKKK